MRGLRIMLVVCWLIFSSGCATQASLHPGPVIRAGASNGKENENRLGVLEGYAFEGLKVGIFPVRKNRMAHPIIGGDVLTGFITKGLANRLPDPERLTPKNYSGLVLAQPGLDWRFIR